MQKINFECENCGAKGTVRLSDDYDDYRVDTCPCCSGPLDTEDDYEDEE